MSTVAVPQTPGRPPAALAALVSGTRHPVPKTDQHPPGHVSHIGAVSRWLSRSFWLYAFFIWQGLGNLFLHSDGTCETCNN